MDIIALLLDGFVIAFQPLNLIVIIVGVIVGLFIGAMPGLGSVNGVATVSYTHLTLPTNREV